MRRKTLDKTTILLYNSSMQTHLAIIKPKSLAKILAGSKTIESRFAIHRPPAWQTEAGDAIYFKVTGGDILCQAIVTAVDRYHLAFPGDLLYLEPKYWRGVHGSSRNIAYWSSAINRGVQYAVFVHLAEVTQLLIPASTLDKRLPYASAWILNFIPPTITQSQMFSAPHR